MAKPTTDLSDDQLSEGIKTGEDEGRDALIAAERTCSLWRIPFWKSRSPSRFHLATGNESLH
jgi:hypothetical protein